MFTVINKEFYSTLELLLAQMFGVPYEVQFASYRVPALEDQDFDNATQFYFSIVMKEQEDE